ncbi:MAG: DUF4398 domain-containing protein, partial [Gammaproteobacteria bacterium]|nr:DUF4398 domain-containing protein [Gammaproteobacteria bacterium]
MNNKKVSAPRVRRHSLRKQAGRRFPGFTLLELLVVLAILGLIATFAAPRALKWLAGAKSDSARIQIEALSTGIDLYRLEVGSYPPDLEALVARPPEAELSSSRQAIRQAEQSGAREYAPVELRNAERKLQQA